MADPVAVAMAPCGADRRLACSRRAVTPVGMAAATETDDGGSKLRIDHNTVGHFNYGMHPA